MMPVVVRNTLHRNVIGYLYTAAGYLVGISFYHYSHQNLLDYLEKDSTYSTGIVQGMWTSFGLQQACRQSKNLQFLS